MTASIPRQCCSVRCPQRISRAANANSCAIDPNNFAREWPIVCTSDQARSDGILTHVIPFRGVAFVAAQQVIERSRLPERGQFLAGNAGRLAPVLHKGRFEMSLQSFDPIAQSQSAAEPKAYKQMDVVRHDDVTTDPDRKICCPPAVIGEGCVHLLGREYPLPLVGIKRDEIKRRVETSENQIKPRRLIFEHALHVQLCTQRSRATQCCSVRCPQRSSGHFSAEDSGRYSADGARST